MSEWHALAKLRMHTEGSLELMEGHTKELGELLRQFRRFTCSQFCTVELPHEAAARMRQKTQKNTSAETNAPQVARNTDNQNNGQVSIPNDQASTSKFPVVISIFGPELGIDIKTHLHKHKPVESQRN